MSFGLGAFGSFPYGLGGQTVVDLAATLSGVGSLSSDINKTKPLSADLVGLGTLSSQLSNVFQFDLSAQGISNLDVSLTVTSKVVEKEKVIVEVEEANVREVPEFIYHYTIDKD